MIPKYMTLGLLTLLLVRCNTALSHEEQYSPTVLFFFFLILVLVVFMHAWEECEQKNEKVTEFASYTHTYTLLHTVLIFIEYGPKVLHHARRTRKNDSTSDKGMSLLDVFPSVPFCECD